jgi:serine/threonine protein kinase
VSPDNWSEIETLYHAAIERDPAERLAFLKRACADHELRREVESLLDHAQTGDWLLESPPWESEPALHIGTRLGPYEIVSMIGSGGMGKVYQAIDTRLDRKVAIKVTTRQFGETFEREARAVAALNHPHVATLYDVGPNYLVMELVEGETLAARLYRGPLTAQTVARYGADIADALAAAHARGIVHCDLKPSNILLSKTGVKVLDFGIAKFLRASGARDSQNPTSDGTIVGTLAYMAPEQWASGQCDERSDIYSLGLVLAEMLTAKQVSEAPAGTDGEQEGQISPNITETPLDRIIRKCLAKDPEERWQSARDLKTMLDWAIRPYAEHQKSSRSKMLGWGIVAATVAIAATIGWFFLPRTDPLPAHFLLSPPEGNRIALRMPTKALATVAPDGQRLVLVAEDDAGKRSLWLRALSSTGYQHLDQTDGA